MKPPVTIRQIARESGVSISTVSRVINSSAPVSPDVRRRVEHVIEKYAYTPNSFARGLVNRKSMIIGVVMPDITNPYFTAIFQEVSRAAQESGYSVLLFNTGFTAASAGETTRNELEAFKIMQEKSVDGVLVAGGQADLVRLRPEYLRGLEDMAERVPTVVLGNPVAGSRCRFIQRERGQGIFMAVDYLSSLGHRRIAFAGGETDVAITEQRLGAYTDALAALGLPCDPGLIATSDYYAPDGWQAVDRLLRQGASFTALIAMNDNVALGAYRALADHGLAVPEDVSVMSCDQFFNAGFFTPRLTSLDQHNEELGRFVIGALLDQMNGAAQIQPLKLRPELVVRESCRGIGGRPSRQREHCSDVFYHL